MSFDWKSLVGTVAPTLGTALLGPMAGMAVKKISESLGLRDGANEKDVSAALQSSSPEILASIQKADQEFAVKMEELGVDLEKIAKQDRDSARNREIATDDNAPKVLASVIVIGFFATLSCVAFLDIPVNSQQPVNILLGSLTALLIQVGNYYFGSSAGSKDKTKHLAAK